MKIMIITEDLIIIKELIIFRFVIIILFFYNSWNKWSNEYTYVLFY
jgi:hypothetical protein